MTRKPIPWHMRPPRSIRSRSDGEAVVEEMELEKGRLLERQPANGPTSRKGKAGKIHVGVMLAMSNA